MHVLGCQIEIPVVRSADERAAHVARLCRRIESELARAPAALVVLPELCTIDYSREAFARLGELAEPEDGPSCAAFGALARRCGVHVSFGLPRVDAGRYYISQLVVGPDGGLVGCYDKLHLAHFGASMEKDYFARGGRLLVFEVAGWRVAPIICYDFRFPELLRSLCLGHGVDLVIHAVAFYRDASYPSWHSVARCRAVENQIYFLSLNRAGDTFGGSIFCPPWIDAASRETVLDAKETYRRFEIDRAVLAAARERYPLRADRLERYEDLPLTSREG